MVQGIRLGVNLNIRFKVWGLWLAQAQLKPIPMPLHMVCLPSSTGTMFQWGYWEVKAPEPAPDSLDGQVGQASVWIPE